mgnify:CR=1 FL=1
MYTQMTNCTFDSLNYNELFIRMNDRTDHAAIDALAAELLAVAPPNSNVTKAYEQGGGDSDDSGDDASKTKVEIILDRVFYGLIAVTMFLCFFSLSASMSANLYN